MYSSELAVLCYWFSTTAPNSQFVWNPFCSTWIPHLIPSSTMCSFHLIPKQRKWFQEKKPTFWGKSEIQRNFRLTCFFLEMQTVTVCAFCLFFPVQLCLWFFTLVVREEQKDSSGGNPPVFFSLPPCSPPSLHPPASSEWLKPCPSCLQAQVQPNICSSYMFTLPMLSTDYPYK